MSEMEDRSPATVARRLSTLSSFYRYALDEEVIPRNPVSSVRRPKVGTDTVSTGLDREELTALAHAAEADSARSFALVLLLGLNGLRISEVLGSDVDDLDNERGHRVLRVTRKGGKKATIPLAPRTTEAVDVYVAIGRPDHSSSPRRDDDGSGQKHGGLSDDWPRTAVPPRPTPSIPTT